ncbi:MAG: hypothetical protein P8O17_05400 [Candidatus Marinimicrobia bacterium]|jgi:hypothetical protein|nr:hypothetical protein [Candidatus Neomarinimicrobiota bacterium]|tara:strand:- start:2738 stop:3154 length:417 start_codon:yes stop_codon:yes gene_type:complete
MDLLFFLNVISAFLLTGVIWTIQIVHYPSFHYIDKLSFTNFHHFHERRISIIVMPLMLIELTTSTALYINNMSSIVFALNLLIVVLIWCSTFFIQVPIHSILSQKKDKKLIEKLVNTNWIRTFLWSMRMLLIIDEIIT